MKPFTFKNPKFIKSAILEKDYPHLKDDRGKPLPEIALVGRSNVGKSSLLNMLFQTKGLAKTSKTPGKTALINFFTSDNRLSFVDLPGYGYAKIQRMAKKNWDEMVSTYFKQRKELSLLLLLLDIRHHPSEEDKKMVEWIGALEIPTLIVFTKVDKVGANERVLQSEKILNQLSLELPFVYTSALKNEGQKELKKRICEFFCE